MSKWPLPLACLLVTGCFRAPENTAAPAAVADTPAPPAENSTASAPAVSPVASPVAFIETPPAPETRFLRELEAARLEADSETRSARLAEVFREWATTDLVGARQAASGLVDVEERLSAHEGVLSAALVLDVREAVAWVLGLQPPALSAVLLDQALADWVRVDARAAGGHVGKLAESDYRTVLAGEVARAWVARDPAAAAAWSAALTDQEAREEALRAALGDLMTREPRRAAELALAVPSEGDRAITLELAVESWWQRDPDALSAWAAQLVDERHRTHVARLIEAQREATAVGAL